MTQKPKLEPGQRVRVYFSKDNPKLYCDGIILNTSIAGLIQVLYETLARGAVDAHALLSAEKQRGLRAVEELKEQNIRLRAEMTELLEAIRLSPIAPDDRTDEARLSCMKYLKHIREQEAKSRAAKEPS